MRKNKNAAMKKMSCVKGCIIAALLLICIIPSVFAVIVYAQENTIDKEYVPMQMYHPDLDTGFSLTNKVDKTVYGSSAYTTLSVETNSGDITTSSYNGFTAYGINGTNVSVNFKINYKASVGQYLNGSSQWMLCDDSWGLYADQKVNGVTTAEIDSGTIIVQTSYDGKNWANDNKAKYSNGLYTTDYYTHHGANTKTIYIPDGDDVARGVYVRVLYAYEVYDYVSCSHDYKNWHGPFYYTWDKKHDNDNVYHNYVEAYAFYLCNNNPDAITFHNLSATDKFPAEMLDEDGNVIESYKQSETMLSGAGTVTGFVLDDDLNPASTIEIYKNGTKINIPSNKEFRDNGRYDIKVTTPLGAIKQTSIFVDTSANEESLTSYFGEGFLNGSKRIYSEGSLPVFEGGKTFYSLKEISEYQLPLSGTIKNITTGSVTPIDATRVAKNGVISDPGEYEVKLTTNASFATDKASGDAKVFTFRFIIIEEGTAPGPVCNQQHLKSYASSNVNDSYPFYYGITFPSANKGYITLAFADYDSAVDYAYNYEKGVVEQQSDGSYVYKGVLSLNGRKQEYNSTWDLTDAMYYFATQAVTLEYFDMSEEHTYLTLDKELLENTSNLRALELDRSVIIFVTEEHRTALITSDHLPIIYPKKYAYLTLNDGTKIEHHDFEFVKDLNGYDSHKVQIVDCEGNVFDIEYNRGVGQQLLEKGCATGVITIVESTVYGDSTSYQAVFISKDTNTATVTVDYKIGNENKTAEITQNDNGLSFEANIFSLRDVIDSLDPYSIIKIVKDGKTHEQQVYCIKDVCDLTFGAVGIHEFTCVSRLGFTFSFSIAINSPSEIQIDFEGIGLDSAQSIITHYQAKNIILPEATRYGYTLVGYSDRNGNLYNQAISEILFKADTILKPVWEAKQYKINFDSNVLPLDVTFGEEYSLPIPVATAGYSFVSWTLDNEEISNNKLSILSEGDVNLVAKFEKTHAIVSFDSQGGSAVPSKLCGIEDIIELPTPEREGFKFTGWLYNGQAIEKLTVNSLDDITLTATWEKEANPIVITAIVGGSTASLGGLFFAIKAIIKRRRFHI